MLSSRKSDDAVLAECASLVEVLRDGWDGIAAQVEASAREAA
jgi:hypothetical protein